MPMVRIEIIKGKSEEYKNTLFEAVAEAMDVSLSVPSDKLIQRMYELDETNFRLTPGKTEKFTFIEIALLPGRDAILKKSVISEITSLLGKKLQIGPADVFIILNDPAVENWGHRGLQASEW